MTGGWAHRSWLRQLFCQADLELQIPPAVTSPLQGKKPEARWGQAMVALRWAIPWTPIRVVAVEGEK